MATVFYRSPYRPLDLGWALKAAREAGAPVEVDWDASSFVPAGHLSEPTFRTDIFAFTGPLPERFVHQWDLVEVHAFANREDAEALAKRERDAYGYDDRAPQLVVVELRGEHWGVEVFGIDLATGARSSRGLL